MFGKLIPRGGGSPIPLLKPKLVIGRDEACDIMLPFATVSSKHCELAYCNGCWYVEDLGSRHGIRVNNERCEAACVESGAVLTIGRHRFQLEYRVSSATVRKQRPTSSSPRRRLLSQSAAEEAASARQRPAAPTVMPGLGQLEPCGGGDSIPLLRPIVMIGRVEQCDVTVRLSKVSARHCQLEYVDGYWQVTDLDSTNGTFINGSRIQKSCLMPNDILSVAHYRLRMRYVATGKPPESSRAPLFGGSLLEKVGLASRRAQEKLLRAVDEAQADDGPKRYNLGN